MIDWYHILLVCILIQTLFVGYLKHTDWGWGLTGNQILFLLDFTISFFLFLGFGVHIYFAFPLASFIIGVAIAWTILHYYYKWGNNSVRS